MAVKTRSVPFSSAAVRNINDDEKLEEMPNNKKVRFKVFDVKPIFAVFGSQFQDDEIEATLPCCVGRNGEKETFTSKTEIITVLEKLLSSQSR